MRLDFIKMAPKAFEIFGGCIQIKDIREKLKREKRVLMFDIDGCLYNNSAEIKNAEKVYIERKINNLPEPKIENYCKDDPYLLMKLKKRYNTTKKGLNEVFGLDFEMIKDFDFKEVYKYLKKDLVLKDCIDSFACPKFCFTNGFREKIEPILTTLGLKSCFEIVFCSNDEGNVFIQKPSRDAFKFIEDFLEISPDHIQIYFFDDNEDNIAEASRRGWNAFHVTEMNPLKKHLVGLQKRFSAEDISHFDGMKSHQTVSSNPIV